MAKDGRALIALGFLSIAILFLIYARIGNSEITPDAIQSVIRLSIAFYVMMVLALGAIAYGFYQYQKSKIQNQSNDPFSIISQITWNSKSRKILIASALGYGVFFALTSGILVYQPDVVFSRDYVVTVPSIQMKPCCEIGRAHV